MISPLSSGEAYMLGAHVSRFIQARMENADCPRTRMIERRLARLMGRFYRGRVFSMAGLLVTVDDLTPDGTVRVREIDPLD